MASLRSVISQPHGAAGARDARMPVSGSRNIRVGLVGARNQIPTRQSRSIHVVRAEGEETAVEKSSTAFDPVKNIDEIMNILPHRFPFLLVDRVVEIQEGKSIVGYKNVTINDNFFTGHFPERPIMPGVLQVEALAQLGGILVLEGADAEAKSNFFFGGIENCRFKRPVLPGDTLMMKVEITKFNKKFGICKSHGECYVGEDLVCETDMTLVIAKEK